MEIRYCYWFSRVLFETVGCMQWKLRTWILNVWPVADCFWHIFFEPFPLIPLMTVEKWDWENSWIDAKLVSTDWQYLPTTWHPNPNLLVFLHMTTIIHQVGCHKWNCGNSALKILKIFFIHYAGKSVLLTSE